MKLRLVLSLAGPLAFALYLLFYNRNATDIRLSESLAFRLPVVILVMISALGGAFCAGLLGWGEAGLGTLRRWGERRRERRREQALENLSRAERLRSEGRLRKARRAVRRAVRQDPSLASAHIFAGNLAQEAGDYAEAIRYHALAQELGMDSVVATVRLAAALEAAGRVEEAARVLAQAGEEGKNHPAVLRQWRDLCTRSWQWEEALSVVKKLANLQATPAERKEDEQKALRVLLETAEKRLSIANADGAAELLEEVVQRVPHSAEPRLRLGDAYIAENRLRRAAKVWEKGYRDLGDPEFLRRLAVHYRRLEKNGGGRKVLGAMTSAARERPADPLPSVMVAALLLDEGKVGEAMEWLRKASESVRAWDREPGWTSIVCGLLEARGKLEAGDRLAAENTFREVALEAGRRILGEPPSGVVLRPVAPGPEAES